MACAHSIVAYLMNFFFGAVVLCPLFPGMLSPIRLKWINQLNTRMNKNSAKYLSIGYRF